MKTPDISPAQILSLVTMIVTQLVNAAVVDGNTAKLIIGIAGVVVPFAWMMADAIIRHGRSKVAAATEIAKTHPSAVADQVRR